jgi:hypothetical protein
MSFKSLRLAAVLMLALVCILGCSEGDGDAAKDAAADLKEAAGDVGEKAAEVVADSFDALKGKYFETAKAAFGEMSEKVDGLVDMKKALPEAAQKPLEGAMDTLLKSRDNAQDKLSDVENAGEDTFEEKRSAFDTAMGDFKDAFGKASALFE